MDARDEWRSRLKREPELTREILDSFRGDGVLADRAFAQDKRLRSLGNQFDAYLGVTEDVRAYDETAGLTESERLSKALAEMTNEARFA